MKEIKVTIDGVGSTDTPVQVRINLLESGKVVDTLIVKSIPPYDKLEVLKVE